MKLTKEGFESLVDFLNMELQGMMDIKDMVKGGPSISRDDREREKEYFDKAYSRFEERCESIFACSNHLRSHLDSMRRGSRR